MGQLSFLTPESLPPGLSYLPDFITSDEENFLLNEFQKMELEPFRFHAYVARRLVRHFGTSYEFTGKGLHEAPPVPEILRPFVVRVANAMNIPEKLFAQVLVTHYPVGAPIGWHRDAPMFEILGGISLGSSCSMKLREREGIRKQSLFLERRSAYFMTGPARWNWEHHIPPVKVERWSLTFRTLVD